MKQISVTVYQFDELNDKAKEKAREWYRSCITTDDFQPTVDCLMDDVAKLGFHNVDMFWSVGYCQDDHAYLEGQWRASECWDYDKIKEEIQLEGFLAIAKQFHDLSLLWPEGGIRFHKSRVEVIDHGPELDYGGPYEKVMNAFVSATKELNKWLYHELRDESDHLHSDEQVDEALRSMYYDFTEDGKRCTLGEGA